MNRVATLIIGLGLSLSLAGQAQAVSINFGPETQGGAGPDFSFTPVVPNSILGDAVLSLTLNGDFNGNHEFAEVYLEGLYLGKILNGNSGDDVFNFGNGDNPDPESGSVTEVTGTTTILNLDFASLIADGLLTIEVKTNEFVENDLTTIYGSISYEPVPVVVLPPDTNDDPMDPPSTNPVPEPSTLILLGTGLAGIVAWQRNKRS
ncbi:MAG: PEP-CTERM sorting domain-containing protein [Nitrospirae bacterium]|nr:PEP-CTERM sorting domain-containing protein [Nitrospirota bacterium]